MFPRFSPRYRYLPSCAMGPAVLLVLFIGAAGAAVSPPCEGLTKIPGCIECMSSNKQCYLCHRDRWPVWNPTSGKLVQCKAATTVNAACRTASGDPECAKCDASGWCYQCKPKKYFSDTYNCVPNGATAGTCKAISRNTECAACNPDSTCKLCDSGKLVVPMNAIYINMPGSESKCMTLTQVRAEAQVLTGVAVSLPVGCKEVTPDFKCARCQDGFSLNLTTNKCIKYGDTGGSGCTSSTLKYREYCSKCGRNTAGALVCKQCTWGRVVDGQGTCSINCKQLWGIGCQLCTAAACTKVDPAYANGRR